MHVRAQRGHQLTLAIVVGLVGERAQGAFDRQPGAHQTGELARPHGQCQGAENAGVPELPVPAAAAGAGSR